MDRTNVTRSQFLRRSHPEVALGILMALGMGSYLPPAWSQVSGSTPTPLWIAQTNSPSAREYIRQGDVLYAEEDYEGAIQAYTQSLQLFPSNPYAYYNRGNAYRKLEQYKEAVFDYTRSIRINPGNNFAYLYRGLSLLSVDQAKAAAANFTELIKRDEENAAAYHYRGDANLKLDQRDAAIADYRKAVDLYKRQGKSKAHRQVKEQLKILLQ